jgi:hypothetical protein
MYLGYSNHPVNPVRNCALGTTTNGYPSGFLFPKSHASGGLLYRKLSASRVIYLYPGVNYVLTAMKIDALFVKRAALYPKRMRISRRSKEE